MNRKNFIQSALVASGALVFHRCNFSTEQNIPGKIIGSTTNIGHLLRDKKFTTQVDEKIEIDVAIIGSDISGLTAARCLLNKGEKKFLVFELDEKIGGNAAYDQNEITSYPLAAHYITIPNLQFKPYIDFLVEHNVIFKDDNNSFKINEEYLCYAPEERLFIDGNWQNGIIPEWGLTHDERNEITRFLSKMNDFKMEKGSDGKFAFTIPIALSSLDKKYLALDEVSMYDWMIKNNFTNLKLLWYVDYACKDDFGATSKNISAWAGIHYFSSRRSDFSNCTDKDIITWSNGNGWLMDKLCTDFKEKIKTNYLAVKVTENSTGCSVILLNVNTKKTLEVICKKIIVATPLFVAARLTNESDEDLSSIKNTYHHYPWIVANISVVKPVEKSDIALCWDNVFYNSHSLGYINATQQNPNAKLDKTVFTWYYPFCDDTVDSSRKKVQSLTYKNICDLILADFAKAYPSFKQSILNIDIVKWGHGMVSPKPGFLSTTAKHIFNKYKHIKVAHTDLSGISIFEEAFYQGVNVVEKLFD